MNIHTILSGADLSPKARLLRAAATVASPVYRAAVAARNSLFDAGLRKPRHLGRPTISVGNVTTGGTGKTPMVAAIAKALLVTGHHPAILMRGYKSGDGESDEALVYREQFAEDVPVGVNPDRVAGAQQILRDSPNVDRFILDDGFQHRQAHRDLDIVLIDATNPFGYGRILPRGLLREPARNVARADSVIITRCDQVSPDALADLDQRIELLHGKPPVGHASHVWTGYLDSDDRVLPLTHLADARVAVVSGIANPAAFTMSAAAHIPNILPAGATFADHYDYTRAELIDLLAMLKDQHNPDAIVTTTKDYVKWRRIASAADLPVTVLRPAMEMQLREGGAALVELLNQVQ